MSTIPLQEQRKLKNWNIIMGCLHLVQGLFMFFVSKTTTVPIFIEDAKANVMARMLTWEPVKFFDINLGQTIAWFLLLSAIAHFITVLPKVFPWYIEKLGKKMNLIRWWEYALSSSLMVVVIAYLCGITDFNMLFLLFGINATMNLFGALMEKQNSALSANAKTYEELSLKVSEKGVKLEATEHSTYKTDWTAFIYGCIAGIIPWIVMGYYFFTAIGSVSGEVKVPDFVYWIFPTLFVFFNLFAINMFLQYKGVGKWKDYLWGEKMYILLSLLAKSVLAWIIWGGTLRP